VINSDVGWHKVHIVGASWLVLLLVACAPNAVRNNNAGNQYFEDGAYQDAIGAYRQAQVTAPDSPETHYNAANAFNRQGQLDAATVQTDQALRTADAQLAAWTWYNLGNAYFDAQDWSDAVMAYQEALRLHPDDFDAKHNLELALKKMEVQGDPNEESGANDKQPEQPAGAGQAQLGEPQLTPTGQSEEGGAQGQAMTTEQARRLLRALIGNAENVQQRLQEPLRTPLPPPEQDW
jgi:Ca-activated chloride channel family protein